MIFVWNHIHDCFLHLWYIWPSALYYLCTGQQPCYRHQFIWSKKLGECFMEAIILLASFLLFEAIISADMAARKRSSTFVNGKIVLQTEHLSFDFSLDLMWNFHVMQHWVPPFNVLGFMKGFVSPNCELPRHLFAQMPVRQFDDTKWWIRVPQRLESEVFRSHSSILSRSYMNYRECAERNPPQKLKSKFEIKNNNNKIILNSYT